MGEKHYVRFTFTVVLAVVIGVFVFLLSQDSSSPAIEPGRVVAVVDGEEIKREQLDLRIQDFKSSADVDVPNKNQATARAEFERLVLEEVVIDFLLAREAKKQGLTTDEEEIKNAIRDLVSQFDSEEVFEQQLENLGLSRRLLKQEVENQLLINQYYSQLVEEHDVEVSAEEIQTVYESEAVLQAGAPPIEDVALDIHDELRQQKLLELLTRIIEKLKESTEINILI